MATRRRLLGATLSLPALGLPMLALPAAARAQTAWPERTVRIIVPYPPGGSTDVLTRLIAERLQHSLGQTMVIENRPGAGGNIGMDAVAKSAPDGYTFGAATIGHFSINQYLYQQMPWDIDRDFIPASLTWEFPNVVVVASDHVPAKTLQEFITWARKQPKGVSFGSPGVGTTPHLSGEIFRERLKLDATHVPFRGAAQTIPAMLSGDVTFAIDNLASYIPVIQEGRMRALAVTSAQRWPTLPDVPTMAEAGMDDFVITSWGAFVAPAGTPRPIVNKLNAALKAIAEDEAVKQRFLQAGAYTLWSTPEDAVARGKRERPMWEAAIRNSGAQAN
ncbi:tripartite tricarboxylate transporter substrate binding protein [Roseomonas sp. M0104]|uniref:Tripartite tricarboxylate transporter substrate binding protein n=1 Tax=Teichococcus coralli TaxID=2545983 RepID=A0A845BIY7_9PROT|nr:tripartite tricarboxylate transporter substrate binding protein [Pseudoroseomonas coralli]MXP65142.1 tripartite tricarboxylate transporter substrate binding protein [Pseudoroseomonas coralli]